MTFLLFKSLKIIISSFKAKTILGILEFITNVEVKCLTRAQMPEKELEVFCYKFLFFCVLWHNIKMKADYDKLEMYTVNSEVTTKKDN